MENLSCLIYFCTGNSDCSVISYFVSVDKEKIKIVNINSIIKNLMSGHCDLYDNFNIRILMDRQDLIFKNNSFHFVLNNDGLGYI